MSIFTNKIATQWWPNMIIKESKQTNITFIYYLSLLCSHYVIDLIKKLEMHLMVVTIFLKIKFRHAQISVPKIGIPMSETACINPWFDRSAIYCMSSVVLLIMSLGSKVIVSLMVCLMHAPRPSMGPFPWPACLNIQ